MTRVLVTGAAGFLGRAVTAALVARGRLDGPGGTSPITALTLVDRAPTSPPDAAFPVRTVASQLAPAEIAPLVGEADVIIHLAAALTIASEQDVAAGYALNLGVPLLILEAASRAGHCPRMVFPSSIAVFGGPLPDRVTEAQRTTPQTSYGTAKAMVELALADYARHGIVDGRALRIPIVVTRPGEPSAIVSDMVGELMRGPLVGRTVVSPLNPDTPFPIVTVEQVADNVLNLLERPADTFGASRALHQPGLKTTPREMVDSLARLAGSEVAGLVSFAPDPAVDRVVSGWPSDFATEAVPPLAGDRDVDTVVRAAIAAFG